jgi:hypothetical protein
MALDQGGFISISFQAGAEPTVISRKLATWNASIATMAPAWEQVGDYLLDQFDVNFGQEGGFFGGFSTWPALRPATVKDRLRRGYGGAHPILFRTGELRWSTVMRGASNNVFQVGMNSLVVGTADPRAIFHQRGTRRMAARPIVGIGWKQTTQIVRILGDYVRAMARQAQIDLQGGTP